MIDATGIPKKGTIASRCRTSIAAGLASKQIAEACPREGGGGVAVACQSSREPAGRVPPALAEGLMGGRCGAPPQGGVPEDVVFKTKPEIGLEMTRSACEPSRRPGDIRCGLRPRRQAASGGDRNWGSLCGRHPAANLGVETVFPLFGGEETAGRDTADVMVKIAPAAAFIMRQVRPPAWAPDSSARCTNAILQHRPDRRTAYCAARYLFRASSSCWNSAAIPRSPGSAARAPAGCSGR